MLVQSITLTPENYTGTVRVKVPLPPQHVVRGSLVQVALASATLVELPERFVEPRSDAGEVEVQVEAGKTYRLDRVIAVGSGPTETNAAPAACGWRGDLGGARGEDASGAWAIC